MEEREGEGSDPVSAAALTGVHMQQRKNAAVVGLGLTCLTSVSPDADEDNFAFQHVFVP